MNATQLFAHFDRLSQTPDAIPRLRRFILDLAVRGKLVEQNPNDEPASELLKRIQAEKARLVRAGEIREGKPLPRVEQNEKLFEAPAGWEWVRIRQVTSDRGHTIPSKEFTYIDVTAINKEAGCIADAKILSASDAPSRARKLVRTGDVLYSCVRPYLLNIAIIENDIFPSPIASTAFAVINGFGLTLPKYLWIALRSPLIVECVEAKMRGQAYPAINDSDFALVLFPLPPIDEQRRIVARVDELMELCDRLEAAQAEQENRRDRLVAASLLPLKQPTITDTAALREHAHFFLSHLSRFTTRPEQIQQLRQAILNLAVSGRLVPQDPNNEPVSELLKRIQADKARLVKEGRIKEQELQAPVAAGEIEYELPTNWELTRIGNLLTVIRGASPRPKGDPKYFSVERTSYHWVKISDIRKYSKGRTLCDTDEFLTEAGMRRSVMLPQGTLIVTNSATIGVPIFLGFEGGCIHDGYLAFPYFPISELSSEFFFILFQTLQSYAARKARGMAQLNLNTGLVREFPLGLPPLAEQYRIVAKVDELMALCDRLEAQLTTAQTESRRLLEATLYEALAAA